MNEIGPSSLHDLFSSKTLSYNLPDPNKIEQHKVDTTTFGLKSLKYSGASLWNKLPTDIKGQVDFEIFKKLIKTWEGPSCKCGICLLCKISR